MNARVLPLVLAALAIVSCGRGERANLSNSPASTEGVRSKPSADPATCVNLNRATSEELARLPGVGEVIAERIISYRERHGPFRRPEEVIIIEGFSDKKYRAIEKLICAN
jgi:competence protein ComEA